MPCMISNVHNVDLSWAEQGTLLHGQALKALPQGYEVALLQWGDPAAAEAVLCLA